MENNETVGRCSNYEKRKEKKKMKKTIVALLLALLIVSFAFAGGATETKAKEEEQKTLTLGSMASFASLTPFQPFASNQELQWLMWEFLGTKGTDGKIQGNLAKSWTTDDGVVYDITLYDNIYDSKGNHITSEDVVFCYDTLLTFGASLQYVSVVATGEYTVRMTLINDGIGAFERTMCHVPIVSKAEYQKSGDGMASNPVSTAHYVVTDYVAGSSVTLTRNDNYWQKDESKIADSARAKYEVVKLITITEPASQTMALETGSIDGFSSIDGTQQSKFIPGGEYESKFDSLLVSNGAGFFQYFSGAPNSLVANDVNLRLAIAHAIDRDSLTKGMTGGTGITATVNGSQFATDAPTIYSDSNPYLKYDVELAKQYLAKSNYKGEKLRYLTANKLGAKDGVIIQQYLSEIGINVEIMTYDLMVYLTNYRDPTTYDLAVCQNEAEFNSVYWNSYYGVVKEDGSGLTGWVDPELTEFASMTNRNEGHTQENINKLAKMLDDKMYSFATTIKVTYTVVKKGLVKDASTIPTSMTGQYLIWAEK